MFISPNGRGRYSLNGKWLKNAAENWTGPDPAFDNAPEVPNAGNPDLLESQETQEPQRVLALLKQELDKLVATTAEDVKIEVQDFGSAEDIQDEMVFGDVSYKYHPSDFEEASPGVAFIVSPATRWGGKPDQLMGIVGFYPNWRGYQEGTQFQKQKTVKYPANPEQMPQVALDLIKRSVQMLTTLAPHDTEKYNQQSHEQEWQRLQQQEPDVL